MYHAVISMEKCKDSQPSCSWMLERGARVKTSQRCEQAGYSEKCRKASVWMAERRLVSKALWSTVGSRDLMPWTAGSHPKWWSDLSVIILSHFSHVHLFVTLWAVARQAPLSMGFSRQEYWSGLPCPSPGDLPDPGIEPMALTSPELAGGFFTTSATWEAPILGHASHFICLTPLSYPHQPVTLPLSSGVNLLFFPPSWFICFSPIATEAEGKTDSTPVCSLLILSSFLGICILSHLQKQGLF